MKNKILLTSVKVALVVFYISISCVDSESYIPLVLTMLSLGYIFLFYKVNEDILERWLEK